MPQQRVRVLPHGAVVLVVERVDGAGKSSRGRVGGGERGGGVVVVGQRRVDRRGLVDRCPVRRDEAREGGVGRREGRRGNDWRGAAGGRRGRGRGGGGGPPQDVLDVEGRRVSRLDGGRCVKRDAHGAVIAAVARAWS